MSQRKVEAEDREDWSNRCSGRKKYKSVGAINQSHRKQVAIQINIVHRIYAYLDINEQVLPVVSPFTQSQCLEP